MKNILVSIFALSLWAFILSDIYKDASSKFLSENKCYSIDGVKQKLIKKNRIAYQFSNKEKISYYSPYWLYNDIKKVSCKNSREIASSKNGYHILNKVREYINETIDLFKGK